MPFLFPLTHHLWERAYVGTGVTAYDVLGSFALIESHPRFRDAQLGIIVSSLRALQLFLKKNARLGRLPDYVVACVGGRCCSSWPRASWWRPSVAGRGQRRPSMPWTG